MTKRARKFECKYGDDHFTAMVIKLPEVMCQMILIGYVEAHFQDTYRGNAFLMISKTLNDFLTANRDMMCAMLDFEQEYWCDNRNIVFYKELIVNQSHFFNTLKRRELIKSSFRNLLYHHANTKLLRHIYRQTVVLHLRRYLECGGWDGRDYEKIVDHAMGPCLCVQCKERYFTEDMNSYATSV